MAQLVKTVNNLAIASVKTVENLAIASVKTIDGLDNTSGGGGVNVSDDFNRANSASLGANWTEAAGDTSIVSNTAETQTGGFGEVVNIYSATSLNTVNQYIRFTVASGSSSVPMAIFRYTNSASPFYSIQLDDINDLAEWIRHASIGGATTTIASTALTQSAASTTYGITMTGTGTSTEIRIWVNPTGNIPDSATSWGGDSTPDVSFTTDPGSPVNTGNLVGFGGFTSTNMNFNEWFGGDIP